MSYFGVSLRNGASLGLGTVPALSNPPLLYRLAPSLLLQFAGAETLDSRITFTRTTTATRTNSSGVIESVAINGPRFDYNPTTLAPNGLLIEEQRTNLATYSAQFDNAAWVKVRATITANAIVAPDGTLTGDKFVEDTTASATHLISSGSISFTSGTSYTFSIYVKAAERTQIALAIGATAFGSGLGSQTIFDLSSITASNVSGAVATTTITNVGSGWYRCTATLPATATASDTFLFRLAVNGNTIYTGNGTSGIYIWGAQLEAGAFPTSYIPTVASQVTRTADVATMTGTNFSSWYNATEGTLYASYSIPFDSSVSVFPIVAAIADGTFSNTIASYERSVDDTRRATVRVGGVEQADLTSGAAYVYGATSKQAVAYKVNNFAMSANGATVGVDTSGTVPVVDRLGLGGSLVTGGSLGYLNGTIKQIAFYPRRLTNAELQAITS